MDTSVKHWMSGSPVSVEATASAQEARDRMEEFGIRHLPVVDERRRVVGVLSIDDLRAAIPSERSRVGEIMSYAPETLPADATLREAADRMADLRIGCLPVVDAEGRLAGVLTETDALRALASTLWARERSEQHARREELELLVEGLRRERDRLAERLASLHGVERDLSREIHDQPMDAPEAGADLREVHLVESIDALAARRLAAVDRALEHAEQGRLSLCDGCGGRIPVARLRALPGTTLCVACARSAAEELPAESPFERPPGGRAETGRPELGSRVYTRFGEGVLERIAPFGTCRRCGDVEGTRDVERDEAVCGSEGCAQSLAGVRDVAIVAVEDREVYVDPAELSSVTPAPYD